MALPLVLLVSEPTISRKLFLPLTIPCQLSYIQALTKVINCLGSGKAPLDVPVWSNSVCLKKKNGGLLGLAVGEVLRRLTLKCLGLCAVMLLNS